MAALSPCTVACLLATALLFGLLAPSVEARPARGAHSAFLRRMNALSNECDGSHSSGCVRVKPASGWIEMCQPTGGDFVVDDRLLSNSDWGCAGLRLLGVEEQTTNGEAIATHTAARFQTLTVGNTDEVATMSANCSVGSQFTCGKNLAGEALPVIKNTVVAKLQRSADDPQWGTLEVAIYMAKEDGTIRFGKNETATAVKAGDYVMNLVLMDYKFCGDAVLCGGSIGQRVAISVQLQGKNHTNMGLVSGSSGLVFRSASGADYGTVSFRNETYTQVVAGSSSVGTWGGTSVSFDADTQIASILCPGVFSSYIVTALGMPGSAVVDTVTVPTPAPGNQTGPTPFPATGGITDGVASVVAITWLLAVAVIATLL